MNRGHKRWLSSHDQPMRHRAIAEGEYRQMKNRDTAELSDRVRLLTQRVAQSGPRALGGLFDLTAARLLRLTVAILRDSHQAEDAVQAVFVKVAAQPQKLVEADAPWPYLLMMTRNESLKLIRSRRPATTLHEGLPLPIECPVDHLERREEYQQIWAAIRRLPQSQSEVVVLRIWEELTFEQIAGVVGSSVPTVASRYRYALNKLQRALAPPVEETCHERR
jgi:RNA polymerase sigma-70 factor (ECF subfamily)